MTKLLKTTVILTALILFFSVPALAQEDEQEFEQEENGEEREIEIEQGDYSASIESSFETEDGEKEYEEEFSLEFEVEDGPSIELERSFENETETREQENESSYEVEFTEILPVDGEGETVGEGYNLGEAEFQPLNYTTRDSDGTTVHIIFAETEDRAFGLRLYAAGDFANIEGETISPQEVKIDLEIRNSSREGEYIGLLTEVKSESESELEFEDGREIKQTTGSGRTPAFFSWKNTAQVDGVQTEVLTEAVRSDEDEHDILFMYEPGSEIIHDPKIGFSMSETGSGFFNWLWNLLFGWL